MEISIMSLFLLLYLTGNVTGESNVTGSHKPVEATVGQDVVLPCYLKPSFDVSNLTVEWKQGVKQVHLYRSGVDYLVGQDKSYKDRTSLFHEEMRNGNISLKLTKVNERDAGNYTCFVPKLHSQVKTGNITLIVGVSDVIGSHKPVEATVGQDVVLPCHLKPSFDVSTRTVEWKQGVKQVHLYRSGGDYLVGQDKRYKDRTSLFHEEMSRGNISLKLTKVTELDAGNYTCFVPKLESQVKRGNVTLIVVLGEEENVSNDGITDTVIVTVIGIVGTVAAIGIGLVWKKCRNTEENAGDGTTASQDEMDGNHEAIALNDQGDNAEN